MTATRSMNLPELLTAIVALVFAVSAGLLAWRLKTRVLELSAQLEQLQQQQLFQQQSISGLTAGAVGMDRRLNRISASEKLLHDRQETFQNQQAAEQPYSHAIQLVQQGASAQRLVDELSLSESEADLIVCLHGLRDIA